jgi:hypothetical protein
MVELIGNYFNMQAEQIDPVLKLLYHPVFLSAFFSWFLAQMMKSTIEFFKEKGKKHKSLILTFLWSTGGMPSSHSSVVAALATAVGFTEGFGSSLFIALLFYGLLTVRDALGVRRAAGVQARAINRIVREIRNTGNVDIEQVKEIHGHTTAEVSVGIVLGFFIAVAFCNL